MHRDDSAADVSLTAYYHAIPLHYVPTLLATGSLYSQRRLQELNLPLHPRVTAFRRDRKLHLDGYIHLSLKPVTPLLIDKRQRGYAHALLAFHSAIANGPDASFLRYNPKSWRHRDDFIPVTGEIEKAEFLDAWHRGSYPSAELLIRDTLPLTPHCAGIFAASPEEADWLRQIDEAIDSVVDVPIKTAPHLFPAGDAPDFRPLYEYATACLAAKKALSPPDLPFD